MNKPKVAFVCTHNSCRSQIAEALGRHLASDAFESYLAGTEIKAQINPDAVRLMKELYGIDMIANGQHNKTVDQLPNLTGLVTMGCGVDCPYVPADWRTDWGLDDPTGQSDHVFIQTIKTIERKITALKEALSE